MKTRKKLSGGKKAAVITLAVIVCILLSVIIAAALIFNHYYNKINYRPIDTTDEIVDITDETDFPDTSGTPVTSGNPVTSGEPVTTPPNTDPIIPPSTDIDPDYVMQFGKHIKNILLIGTDARTINDRGRSDTMILASINEKTGQIVLVSFMRDTYIPNIPALGSGNRINAAYAAGGVSLLLSTIKENYHIDIDRYVRINFSGFTNIVNKLGGVDIELTQAEIDYLELGDSVKPGMNHLDGAKALDYCRCRHVGLDNESGDFARTARQRKMLGLLLDGIRGKNVFEIGELLDEFLPEVATNITRSEMLSMVSKSGTYLGYEFVQYRLPVENSWKYATIRRMSVITVDFAKNTIALEKMINGTYGK